MGIIYHISCVGRTEFKYKVAIGLVAVYYRVRVERWDFAGRNESEGSFLK
jgi:hypothetical protein